MTVSRTKILTILLILSFIGNVYFVFFSNVFQGGDVQVLQNRAYELDRQVAELSVIRAQDNVTIRSYASQLDIYREMVTELKSQLNASSIPLQGFATLQGPAVIQRVEVTNDVPFAIQRTVTEGTMTNISVEIQPGEGRVLVETKPLMGIVFQDAANTAVFVAQNITGKHLTGSDVIFSVEAQKQIPAIDGPSAGALMTSLVIAAIKNQVPRQDITLTGTIDQNGHVGTIGGVIEKSQAAKASGKSEILLPKDNARLVQYSETTRRIGGFTYVERTPKVVDAKEYIESEIGIKVNYVDSISDILQYLGLQ